MSDSNCTDRTHINRTTAALVGLVVVFVIVLLVNFLFGKMNFRADLTEYNVFTLSKGTKTILEGLDTPVEIRYYVTDDSDVMSPRMTPSSNAPAGAGQTICCTTTSRPGARSHPTASPSGIRHRRMDRSVIAWSPPGPPAR